MHHDQKFDLPHDGRTAAEGQLIGSIGQTLSIARRARPLPMAVEALNVLPCRIAATTCASNIRDRAYAFCSAAISIL